MLYQLNDSDNESVGLIKSHETEAKIETLWQNWYLKADEIDCDLFVDYLQEKGLDVERVYITEINCC